MISSAPSVASSYGYAQAVERDACYSPQIFAVINDLIYALLGCAGAHLVVQVAVYSPAGLQIYLHPHAFMSKVCSPMTVGMMMLALRAARRRISLAKALSQRL